MCLSPCHHHHDCRRRRPLVQMLSSMTITK
jgi:hypothetical protein